MRRSSRIVRWGHVDRVVTIASAAAIVVGLVACALAVASIVVHGLL